MATGVVLATPHVGTAFGHLFRLAEFLRTVIGGNAVVHVRVPPKAKDLARRLFSPEVNIEVTREEFSVNSDSGRLDTAAFRRVVAEDVERARALRPDLIVGDPGVREAITAQRLRIPWVGIMHGCYLPFPQDLVGLRESQGRRSAEFARAVWGRLQSAIDTLIAEGTDGEFRSWSEIRSTGRVLIPNLRRFEPCRIGEHIGLSGTPLPLRQGTPVRMLLTLCSAGSPPPPAETLRMLGERFREVAVAGPVSGRLDPPARALGSGFHLQSLVDGKTVVITHGGHGTLRSLHRARLVLALPGDLDQLYNSLVASARWGVHVLGLRSWAERVQDARPFQRRVDWGALDRSALDATAGMDDGCSRSWSRSPRGTGTQPSEAR